jgi:hypothetical protein
MPSDRTVNSLPSHPRLITPKVGLIAQVVIPETGQKRDIDSLDAWAAWMKTKSGVDGDARFEVLARREGDVAGLDDIDLGGLAIETARNCGLAFADVGVRFGS